MPKISVMICLAVMYVMIKTLIILKSIFAVSIPRLVFIKRQWI